MLGKLSVPVRPTIWINVGQGPFALAIDAGWGCLDIFTLLYLFSSLSPSLWETARYRLKYCLKGPLNPNNQPTNQYAVDKSMTCWEEIRSFHLHESQPDGSIRGGTNTPMGRSYPK